MILHLTNGEARTVAVGSPTMGLRVLRMEISSRDTFHPDFLGWFGILLTRMAPADEKPDPA